MQLYQLAVTNLKITYHRTYLPVSCHSFVPPTQLLGRGDSGGAPWQNTEGLRPLKRAPQD